MSVSHEMTRDEFHDQAIAHLLGELGPAEEATFRAELARRGAEGRATVRSLGDVLGEVGFAAAEEPPAALRSRVLEAVSMEATSVTAIDTRRATPSRSPWPWAAAAVLAALAIGLAAWGGRVAGERDRLRAVVDDLETRVAAGDSAAARLAALRSDLELATAPASSVHGLVGTAELPQARARVFVDPVTGRALLYAYDLPVLGPDRLYELWAIDEDGARPAGVFRPDDRGQARLEIADAELLGSIEALAVTVEPAPGVEQPTGEIVLSSEQT